MSGWSVIVWAVVAPDLEEAMKEDLKEANTALGGYRPETSTCTLWLSYPG